MSDNKIEMPKFNFPIPNFVRRELKEVIDLCNRFGEDAINKPDYWNCIDMIETYVKDAYICGEMKKSEAIEVLRWCGVS